MLRVLVVVPILAGCGGPSVTKHDTPPASPAPPAPAPIQEAAPTTAPPVPPPAEAEPPAAKPRPPKVRAVARISAAIGSVPPKLTVEVTNAEVHEIQVVKVDKPVCWLPLYLTMTLAKSTGAPVGELLPCKNPGTATATLAPGAAIRVEVGLGELFRGIGKGTYDLDINLDSSGAVEIDTRLVVYGALDQPLRRFTVAKLVKTFTIARGKTVALDNKTQLTFVAHGHKQVAPGGPRSPLIVAAKLVVNGTAEEVGASIQTEDQEPFSFERHLFELVSYNYNESMTLRYWGPVAVDD